MIQRRILAIVFIVIFLRAQAFADQTHQNFTWLLSYSGKSTNDIVRDKRFKHFLAEITPGVKLDLGMDRPYMLKDIVLEFIGGPPDDVMIQENRYVVLSACRSHSCPEKAWLWCDTQNHIVVGVLVHYIYQGRYSGSPSLFLFSKHLKTTILPDRCQRELRKWLDQNQIAPEVRRFVDRRGTVTELEK